MRRNTTDRNTISDTNKMKRRKIKLKRLVSVLLKKKIKLNKIDKTISLLPIGNANNILQISSLLMVTLLEIIFVKIIPFPR